MKAALLVFLLSLATSVLARPPSFGSEEYIDNNLGESIPPEEDSEDDRIDYVSISSAPKKDIYYPAEPIEAECKVTGMPTPQVEWVHNSGSIDNHDFESNTILERSPSGIATVVAKLIIKPHHVKPGTSRTYTCVGRSGGKVAKATTTVHFAHDAKHPQHSPASNIMSSIVGGEAVKIYEYYENLFDNIGSTILMPCKVTDNKAEIFWINESGKVISGQEPRFKVLATGDLMITNLQFKDMGTYICLAKTPTSKAVASTFLYPLAEKK